MDIEQKKILSILSLVKKPIMIKEIAELCGINRHTVARKLDTLEILGRVRKIEIGSAKKYTLVEIGRAHV
jgi:DNA-binding IclR family transcriptional regulator